MSLTPDQLAVRREGITATDVPAIVGCNSYRGPLDVFLEKTGQAPPFEESVRSQWGHLLEPLIRDWYAERHGLRVDEPGTMRHERFPWRIATPDGLAAPSGATRYANGLEIKVHGRDAVFFGGLEYGAPGSDEVPPHELVQCMWNMEVTGLDRWDLVAFLDGAPVEYTIFRDDELIAMLVEKAERFLVDHVRTGTPPPPDGSEAWGRYLTRRWPKNRVDLVAIDSDPRLLDLVGELRRARAQLKQWETIRDRITQEIKLEIGDRAGLTWTEPGAKKTSAVTWKFSADSLRTDWRRSFDLARSDAALLASAKRAEVAAIAEDLRRSDAAALADLMLELHGALKNIAAMPPLTTPTPGPRPFLVPRTWQSKPEKAEGPDE